jgi:hypothetical protein
MWALLAMLGCEWERWMCGYSWGFFLGIDVDVTGGFVRSFSFVLLC